MHKTNNVFALWSRQMDIRFSKKGIKKPRALLRNGVVLPSHLTPVFSKPADCGPVVALLQER
jgi:hypothetical protein